MLRCIFFSQIVLLHILFLSIFIGTLTRNKEGLYILVLSHILQNVVCTWVFIIKF